MLSSLANLSQLHFRADSLKPTSSEVVEKIEKIIIISANLSRNQQQRGMSSPYSSHPNMHPGGFYNPQMQNQYIQQPRHAQQRYSDLPFGLNDEEIEPIKTIVTIGKQKITVVINDKSHFFIRTSKGEWEYTIEKSHYNETLSYYSSLLCDEIIANSK